MRSLRIVDENGYILREIDEDEAFLLGEDLTKAISRHPRGYGELGWLASIIGMWLDA